MPNRTKRAAHPPAGNPSPPLTRLWRELERLPGRAAVEAEWRHRIGDEFDRLRDLLVPDRDRAACYPRLDGRGSAYRIVIHENGEIVGIAPDDGDRITLQASDLIVYRLALPRLLQRLADLFEVDVVAERIAGIDDAWLVGIDRPRAGFAYPLYFLLADEPRDYRYRVAALVAQSSIPFRLLAPTNQFHRHETVSQLEAHGSTFLALADAIVDTGTAWRLKENVAEWFTAFRTRHLPKPKSEAIPTFPTPAGVTWEEVRIRFLDGESVSIRVRDETRSVNYTQMGMNDGRDSKPNRQWKLLRAFADGGGRLDWKSPDADPKNQKRRELLATVLMAYFGLNEDPIVYEPAGKSWRTRFSVEGDT